MFKLVAGSASGSPRRRAVRWGVALVAVASIGASAVASGSDPSDLVGLQQWLMLWLPLHQASWALASIIALSIAGSILGVPVTLLIAFSAMLFGVLPGMLYSVAGTLLGAMLAYAVGYHLDPTGNALMARRLRRVHQRFAHRGLAAIFVLRLLPVFPFTLVNLVCGAVRVRWRDYILGTLAGMLPSILILSALIGQLRTPGLGDPNAHLGTAMSSLLVVLSLAAITPFLLRRFRSAAPQSADASQPRLGVNRSIVPNPLKETSSC